MQISRSISLFTCVFCLSNILLGQNYISVNHATHGGLGNDGPGQIIQDGTEFMLAGQISFGSNLDGNYFGGTNDMLVARLAADGTVIWSEFYGGSEEDLANCIAPVSNGFVIGGSTFSTDGQISEGDPGYYDDAWLIKISETGELLWEKTFGGNRSDNIKDIIVLDDGSIVCTGIKEFAFAGSYQGWIFKTDPDGNMLWENNFGGSLFDRLWALVEADDGGFVMAGGSDSNDGDVGGTNGLGDLWLVKTDSEGNLEWSKTYGSNAHDAVYALKKHPEGYIAAGYAGDANGDVSELTGNRDIWVVWTDEEGNILREKTFGNEDGYSISWDIYGPVNDNHWIVAGFMQKLLSDNSSSDAWVAEIDDDGEVIWSVASGGSSSDDAFHITSTESGYLMAGRTDSEDEDLESQTIAGNLDLWVYNLEITVNTRNLSDPSIVVFPNPTEQVLRVAGMDAIREIRLFEMGGKTVKTVANQNHMNVSELPPGTYTAEFRNENTVVTRKIVIR